MEKSNYTKEILSEMGIYQLRQIAWQYGVRLPTTYKKFELIDLVLKLQKSQDVPTIQNVKKGRPAKTFLIEDNSWFNDEYGVGTKKQEKPKLITSWEHGDWLKEVINLPSDFTFGVFQPDYDENSLVEFSGVFVKELNGCGAIHLGTLSDILKDEVIFMSAGQVLEKSLKSGDTVKGKFYVTDDGQTKIHILELGDDIFSGQLRKVMFDNLAITNIKQALPLWNNKNLIFTKYLSPLGKGQRAVVCGAKKSGKTFILTNMAEEFANLGIHTIYLSLNKRPENEIQFSNKEIENIFIPFDVRPFRQTYVFDLAFERAKRFCEAGKDVAIFVDDFMSVIEAYDNYFQTKGQNFNQTTTLDEIKKHLALARNTSQGGSLTIVGCLDTQKEQSSKWRSIFEDICNCRIYLDKNLKLMSNVNVLPESDTDNTFENFPNEFVKKGKEIKVDCIGKNLSEIATIYESKMR